MTTMNIPDQTQEANVADNTPQLQGEGIDLSPSEKLRNECFGCRLSFSWFSTSKQVDKLSKQHMATSVETTEGGFSASKRLMDSRHPAIKEANELRNRIHNYWNSMTVPLAAAAVLGEAKLEGGTRLIRKDHVEEFHERMSAFQSEAGTIAGKVTSNLEDIKKMDKDRLGTLYNPDDYPEEINLSFSWGFPNVDIPSQLERLAPEVFEHERQMVASRFEHTWELAQMTMLEEFQAVFASWVDRLGSVIRVYPPDQVVEDAPELGKFRDAEILEREEQEDGQCKWLLRLKVKQGRKPEEWVGPMEVEAFNDAFKPSAMANERKTFRQSTIENLTDLLAKFGRLGDTVSSSDDMKQMVKNMEDHLASCRDASEITSELKNSKTFRHQTHSLAQQLKANIEAEIHTFKARRHVNRGMMADE